MFGYVNHDDLEFDIALFKIKYKFVCFKKMISNFVILQKGFNGGTVVKGGELC